MTTATNGINGHTSIRVTKAKKTEQPKTVDIPDMEKSIVQVHLVGISPLIVNNFTEKSIDEMEYERSGAVDAKQKRKLRPPVVPEEKFNAARILDEKGRDCICARWIKACLVTAAKYPDIDIAGTKLRGALFVLGDLIPIECAAGPRMRRDVVRVGKFGNKQPDLRYRPEYTEWSLSIRIEFEPKLIPLAQLHHLLRRGGSSVGLCEWRPEKSPGGIFGRFDIGART